MSIRFIGTHDRDLKMFENQYPLSTGMSYNSYLIDGQKTAVMDSVDERKTQEWLDKLEKALAGRPLDYLIVQHMEPDHSGSLAVALDKYPNVKVVGNNKTFNMIHAFFPQLDLSIDRKLMVQDKDILDLGDHKLQFFFAPMVHWPEVMMTYDMTEQVLFSADAFGKFGCGDVEDDWVTEARRYYFNIVGKYGPQVQTLLKKLSGLEIRKICGLHGPQLTENLDQYLGLYQTWSSYAPEEKGVFIPVASIYGHTLAAAREAEKALASRGIEIKLMDLTKVDVSEAVAQAFRFDRMLLAASSYDAQVYPPMQDFLHHLANKAFQGRKIAIMENGSWGPTAARTMKKIMEGWKNIEFIEPQVTIRSTLNEESREKMAELVEALAEA